MVSGSSCTIALKKAIGLFIENFRELAPRIISHAHCHMIRGQAINRQPKNLLTMIPRSRTLRDEGSRRLVRQRLNRCDDGASQAIFPVAIKIVVALGNRLCYVELNRTKMAQGTQLVRLNNPTTKKPEKTMSKTTITGKDASLEETIDSASGRLQRLGIEVTASSWLNPVTDCWSVHLQAVDCPQLSTNGKGRSRQACLASGLGEFFERLGTDFFFADYHTGTFATPQGKEEDNDPPFYFHPDERWFYGENVEDLKVRECTRLRILTPELHSFYNPDNDLKPHHLYDHNVDGATRGVAALPFGEYGTRNTVFFPVNILNNLYVSNGMAAGNSPSESRSQALSEIIERHVKNRVIAEGTALPDIPEKTLHNYPRLTAIIDELKAADFLVRVKDASLGGRFPVVCVLLTDRYSSGVFAAFGCNCRFAIAVERTLTELLQGRRLDQLRNFNTPIHNQAIVASPDNLESHFIDSDGLLGWRMFCDKPDFTFTPWDFKGSTQAEFDLLTAIITREGFNLYLAEYNHCGMQCCRLIVPGMSEIYPVDDLVWNNRNSGAPLRPLLLRLPQMTEEELNNVLSFLETTSFGDELLISHLIGVVFEDLSPWATLRVGELKALVYLALKQTEEAMDWCGWCVDFGQLPDHRTKMYRLIYTMLGIAAHQQSYRDYMKSLGQLYSEDEILTAKRIIDGEHLFFGLDFDDSWQQVSAAHKKLLAMYEKINRVKRDHLAVSRQP